MIYNDRGTAYPDWQDRNQLLFKREDQHDNKQWKWVSKNVFPRRTCIDFGGHVGITAKRYASCFQSVITIEPIPDLYECLEYNTSTFDNIKTLNKAVGNKNENVVIHENHKNSGSSMISTEFNKDIVDRRWGSSELFEGFPSHTVEQITIDSLNLTNVDFVKMDTEGYIIEPLEGMRDTLKRCSPMLEIERPANHLHNHEVREYMKDIGYRLVHVIEREEYFVKA